MHCLLVGFFTIYTAGVTCVFLFPSDRQYVWHLEGATHGRRGRARPPSTWVAGPAQPVSAGLQCMPSEKGMSKLLRLDLPLPIFRRYSCLFNSSSVFLAI